MLFFILSLSFPSLVTLNSLLQSSVWVVFLFLQIILCVLYSFCNELRICVCFFCLFVVESVCHLEMLPFLLVRWCVRMAYDCKVGRTGWLAGSRSFILILFVSVFFLFFSSLCCVCCLHFSLCLSVPSFSVVRDFMHYCIMLFYHAHIPIHGKLPLPCHYVLFLRYRTRKMYKMTDRDEREQKKNNKHTHTEGERETEKTIQ